MNTYYQKAQDFIASHDLNALPLGTTVIDEGNVWVNIVETELRDVTQARLEAHNLFLDIHVPLSCGETYGVAERSACTPDASGYDAANDIVFFNEPVAQTVSASPGQQTLFEPSQAHAPLIGSGPIRKAIFKVRV